MSRFWDQHAQKIDVHRFRGNDQYLWQPEHYPYEKIVDYLERRSLRYLITLLGEDEAFGCVGALYCKSTRFDVARIASKARADF